MFKTFRDAIEQNLTSIYNKELFVTDVDKDKLWDLYLDSFVAGTNPLFKERSEHDCNSCKQFVRTMGAVVYVDKDYNLVSIWDVDNLDSVYSPVAKALSKYVKSKRIVDLFTNQDRLVSKPSNLVQLNGNVHTWHHLSASLPSKFVKEHSGTDRSTKQVFQRGLDTLTNSAIDVVLELIAQKSLYRGEEHRSTIIKFKECKTAYEKLSAKKKSNYCWNTFKSLPGAVSKLRNTSIGTLLVDLSEGVELDTALRKYESVVAPANYKRPKAIYTESMVRDAKNKLAELGLQDSLGRRFATIEDINVGNILWSNTDTLRKIVVADDPFSDLVSAIPRRSKNFANVDEIFIEEFISDVLPKTKHLELYLENRFSGNMVSLIAPTSPSSPSLMKWNNNFSWAYSGNVTDSMKDLVKERGGNVDGVLRFSIQWNEDGNNTNDYDAHCREPNSYEIYFSNKGRFSPCRGKLDVDIILPVGVAVENIIYEDFKHMDDGRYKFFVRNYSDRGGVGGFRAEVEFNGQIYCYDYPHIFSKDVAVATVTLKNGTLSIEHHIDSTVSSRSIWNKPTNEFHPVTVMFLSPNYWNTEIGNKHYFFMLDDCLNPDTPNGFFNEYLKAELTPHRKVFEALGSLMRVSSDNPKQLSGVGFSNTKPDFLTVKITGNDDFVKVLKVVI